jgi:hypothetical protein
MTHSDSRAVKLLAKRHLVHVSALFLSTLMVGVVGLSIADWAEAERGWQSGAVELAFRLVGGFSLLSSLIFGIMVWAWFAGYKGAISSAKWFEEDPEGYRRSFGDVIGPIPWGLRRSK